MTLLRGYGMTTITLWQDLARMQTLYDDWRTLLNNCAVVETLGASTWEMAKNLGDVFGVAPEVLRDMPPEHALVSAPGTRPFQVRRSDCLRDRPFCDRRGSNPWFSGPGPGASAGPFGR
ncbi:MAG: TraM recognition domain-containing protein [Planctomycetota bacterium]